MNQKTRTSALADQSLLSDLISRGYVIDQSEAVQEYLDRRNVNAATFLDKELLLRPDARHTEVLEEYLHNVQHQLGMTNYLTLWQLELHVKDFMVRHQRLLGITEQDVTWLEQWLHDAEEMRT